MPPATERELRAAEDAPDGTVLVVLGMHRSGTSALARCCNVLGVDLGSDFIPTRPDNEAGFWEDARIKDADDLALAALGLVWDDVRPLPEHWQEATGIRDVQERVLATLEELRRRAPLHGVKDPRISRLLPVWMPLFARLGTAPRFLIALREPEEVAASLARRDGLARARAHLLWLRYTLEAEQHTRGHPRAFVCFDDLLRDWRATMAQVASRLDLTWPVSYADAARELDRFLDPGLRHHRVGGGAAGDLALARRAHEVYATLRATEGEPTPAQAAVLDRVRAELAGADRLLAPVLAELEAAIAVPPGRAAEGRDGEQRAEPGEQRTDHGHEGHAAEGDGAAARRSAHEREIDRVRRDLALAHELVWRRDAELREAGEALEAERARLADELAASRAQLAARAHEVATLRARLEAQQAELAATHEQVAAALRALADVEGSLSWRLTAPLRSVAAIVRGGSPKG